MWCGKLQGQKIYKNDPAVGGGGKGINDKLV